MERVNAAELRDGLTFARSLLMRAEMADRSFLGRKLEYRDHVVVLDWYSMYKTNAALRIALNGGRVNPTNAGIG